MLVWKLRSETFFGTQKSRLSKRKTFSEKFALRLRVPPISKILQTFAFLNEILPFSQSFSSYISSLQVKKTFSVEKSDSFFVWVSKINFYRQIVFRKTRYHYLPEKVSVSCLTIETTKDVFQTEVSFATSFMSFFHCIFFQTSFLEPQRSYTVVLPIYWGRRFSL